MNLGYRPENDILWRNVHSQEGGTYNLVIRLKAGKAKKMYLQLNGGDGIDVEIPALPQWQNVTVKALPLHAGENTIRLYNDADIMPEVDFIEIKRES